MNNSHKNIWRIILLAITLLVPLFAQLPMQSAIGKPYGGGSGYFPILSPEECTVIIANNDFNNLKNIVENADYGDKIYINDDLKIEIPAYGMIKIPDGVTLASGRGRNGSAGALIFLDHKYSDANWRHHIIAGSNVRITGLRLRGPDATQLTNSADYCPGSIYQNSGANLEVENCEIYNWYWVAIRLVYSTNANIHHNYIHNNQKPGAGYGVQVGWKSTARISYNIFNYNRHSISGNGFTEINEDIPSYTAEYNLILPCANGTRFDMHGFFDECDDHTPNSCGNCNYWEPCNIAGGNINIRYNAFVPRLAPDNISDRYMIMIRGIPKYAGHITNNAFGTEFRAVKQRLYTGRKVGEKCPPNTYYATVEEANYMGIDVCMYWGNFDVPSNNMKVSSNIYDAEIYLRQIDWGGNSAGFVTVAPEIRFSDADTFEFGDFNSDGRTDIINQGYISYSGLTAWEAFTGEYSIDTNHLIDFNGDGKEDSIKLVHPADSWPNGCY